ncbi:hypothetical protein SHIRM173S_06706 [Streptomyces hirsutus]
MSVHDELASVQRNLDDLIRSVGRLEKQFRQRRPGDAPRPVRHQPST